MDDDGDDPPPPQDAHVSATAAINPTPSVASPRAGRYRASRRRAELSEPVFFPPGVHALKPASSAIIATSVSPNGPLPRGHTRRASGGPTSDRAVVVTVTVTFAAANPFSVTEAGATLQAAPAGAPLQVNDTVPCNPYCGSTANA